MCLLKHLHKLTVFYSSSRTIWFDFNVINSTLVFTTWSIVPVLNLSWNCPPPPELYLLNLKRNFWYIWPCLVVCMFPNFLKFLLYFLIMLYILIGLLNSFSRMTHPGLASPSSPTPYWTRSSSSPCLEEANMKFFFCVLLDQIYIMNLIWFA